MLISRKAAVVLLSAMALTACNKGDGKKPATQVAVKVNGDEISVHQINSVLARIPNLPPEQADAAKRQILDKLIDQQLTIQQAAEKKLDRTPEVVTAIENAKREILAKAYLDQLASGLSKPSPDEAKKYFADHPDLFSNRHVYNLQEITLPAKKLTQQELQDAINGKSMQDIANWLKEKGIPFRGNAVARPAEQIPLELLPKLAALKPGQTMVADSPQAVSIMHLVASQPDPVTEEKALPQILQYLANIRAGEAVKADLAQLRQKAKLEYMGEFAADAAATPKPITAPAAAPAANGGLNVDKGVAGLK